MDKPKAGVHEVAADIVTDSKIDVIGEVRVRLIISKLEDL